MNTNNQTLTERFLSIRKKTEALVSPLEIEDFVAQPVVDVSPPKWHLGHTSWFFENFILAEFDKSYQRFSEDFAFIFNSYYESQGERILRNKRGTLTRPSTKKIFDYRQYVDEHMVNFLSKSTNHTKEVLLFFDVGLNHEQQHQELLVTDIKYILGSNPLMPAYYKTKTSTRETLPFEWLKINAGNYKIGYQGERFHFDNEEGEHTVYLHDFEIANRLVTNGEFIEFINDGAYQRPEFWLMEGWEWVKNNQASAPFYWFQKEQQWYNYQLDGVSPVIKNEAVTHINFYEADAYARWKGLRLPTEQEWEVAAKKYGSYTHAHFQGDNDFQPRAADHNQFFGSTWEWTNSAYLPYPYYKQEKGALGEYNGKFMINQMVLRGGSCATPTDHFRVSYRNFFHPHLQWQFTGIRLAKTT